MTNKRRKLDCLRPLERTGEIFLGASVAGERNEAEHSEAEYLYEQVGGNNSEDVWDWAEPEHDGD
eukprot:1999156-Rhodomonas_salina.1